MSFSAAGAPPAPPRRRWIWWTLGGCGSLVVLAIAAVVVIVILVVRSANPSGNCLPSGFPVDPGLTKVTSLKLGATCTTAYRTGDSTGSVEDYYANALERSGWQVTARRGATIRFQRAGRTSEAGTVTVTSARGRTQVAVVLRNG